MNGMTSSWDEVMRIFSLMLAIALATPLVARGRAVPQSRGRAQSHRWRDIDARAIRSPSGRHVLEIADGVITINGLPVHVASVVQLVGNPVWRADSDAVAWIERSAGEIRLVVLSTIAAGGAPLQWVLPSTSAEDRVYWTGAQRVIVGPVIVEPRAVASWTEDFQ